MCFKTEKDAKKWAAILSVVFSLLSGTLVYAAKSGVKSAEFDQVKRDTASVVARVDKLCITLEQVVLVNTTNDARHDLLIERNKEDLTELKSFIRSEFKDLKSQLRSYK